ncbi:MAG TPA: Sua5 family C-terminal domain-containing protein, partial [Aggregatilineales bacterium]|nr:Sua5 family C-terminal domain-containing protein [Aggregatilineales bacterium]
MESLREVIPDVQIKARYAELDETVSSPGQLLRHYSPAAKVILFAASTTERA